MDIKPSILFIDPGSITSGYAWREGNRIVSGTIDIKKSLPVPKRLRLIRAQLSAIIEAQDVPAFGQAVIEVPAAHAYGKRTGRGGKSTVVASMFIMSRALGVIEECCEAHSMPVVEILATKWTEGFPKGYRCPVASGIVKRPIEDENEADAICLLDWYERIGQHGG